MQGLWSLLFFTIFAQAAVGMTIFKTLFTNNNELEISIFKIKFPLWAINAISLLILAALISLFHLSAPLNSFYTITNAMTSWLSREILSLGLFGATLLGVVFFRTRLMYFIAAFAGIFLVYVISNVYMIPAQPTWNTWLTFANFLSSALVLGSTLIFLLDCIHYEGSAIKNAFSTTRPVNNVGKLIRSWRPVAVLLSIALSLTFVAWQFALPEARLTLMPFVGFFVFVLLGLSIGAIALLRSKNNAPVFAIALATALIWLGEICGRMVFYSANVHFGM